MRIVLTAEQSALVQADWKVGFVLLGKIGREQFDGANATTCGRFELEVGFVPESSLQALRNAVRKSRDPKGKKPRRKLE